MSNQRKSLALYSSADIMVTIAEWALRNDRLRRLLAKEAEKRMLAVVAATANPNRPARVLQDKQDLVTGLVRSAERALARRQLSPQVVRRLLRSLLFSVALHQSDGMDEAFAHFSRDHGVDPPVTMVISPGKTCNLHCTGCYASSGPTGERLDWDVFNRLITEAKTLWGLRLITISGGEPLAYRSQGKGILDAAALHNDCFFLMYTNGTLIDKKMAAHLAEVGNLVPAISVEGFQARTDERRGAGVFQKILDAMANLREAGVPYGISLTATRQNTEEILSDEFLDFFFDEQQALFGWLFQYMPIGRSYTLKLLPTPEQRLWMWRRTWQVIRERKIMLADFWNCGTVSDGCIAGGREAGYLYIDWNGKVMPCVFVPYAAANINELYSNGGDLNDLWELPYFKAIRAWQWDYAYGKQEPEQHGNWLLPCSLRDHYGMGRELIDTYGPEPEDQAAAEALLDGNYYEGLMAYDESLETLFEPVWEQEYLAPHRNSK
jgi:MoaA/NifB/PqqE/SkfB family radical SAM enzyme